MSSLPYNDFPRPCFLSVHHLTALVPLVTKFFVKSFTPAAFLPSPQPLATFTGLPHNGSSGVKPMAATSHGSARSPPVPPPGAPLVTLPGFHLPLRPSVLHLLLCPASPPSRPIPSISPTPSPAAIASMSPKSLATKISTCPPACWLSLHRLPVDTPKSFCTKSN